MPDRFERFLKFLEDFTEGRLSHDDEMDLYAWRRLLPKNERAYRNRSSRRKICIMISKFFNERFWWEDLMKQLKTNDEQFKRMVAALKKNIPNEAS